MSTFSAAPAIAALMGSALAISSVIASNPSVDKPACVYQRIDERTTSQAQPSDWTPLSVARLDRRRDPLSDDARSLAAAAADETTG